MLSSEEASLKETLCHALCYSSHAGTDTSAAKDESWVQNGKGHETH